MTTNAKTNYGITFGRYNSGSYVSVGELASVEPPELKKEAVDATHHGSQGKEWVSSNLFEAAEFTITINFVPAGFYQLYTDMNSGSLCGYQMVFPTSGSGTTWTFDALVTSLKPNSADAESPEALTFDTTFQPSGVPVLS